MFSRITTLLGLLFVCGISFAQNPVKIMPLGNSLTEGNESGGAYRPSLWRTLKQNNLNVDFVGTNNSGPSDIDGDHEGHSGYTIGPYGTYGNIIDNINSYLVSKPDIILLEIGFNEYLGAMDGISGFNADRDSPVRLTALLDKIYSILPNVKILVGNLTQVKWDPFGYGKVYCEQVPIVVQAQKNKGRAAYFVDFRNNPKWDINSDLTNDMVHPNPTGAAKMADLWFATLKPILQTNVSADTQAPTAPSLLKSTSSTFNSTQLAWNASSDNTGVSSYSVFQNGVEKISSTTNSISITGLAALATYTFKIRALDAAGNVSGFSNEITVTTPAVPINPNALVANKTSGIVIDGNLDETSWKLNTCICKKLSGNSDNSGTFAVKWDDQFLYIGISVLDNSVKTPNQASQWDGDGVDLYFDMGAEKSAIYDSNDGQITMAYGQSVPFSNNATFADGIKYAYKAIAGGYSLEAAVAWQSLGFVPANNKVFNFDIALNDNDNGASRDAQNMWNGTGNNWSSTVDFGSIVLQPSVVTGYSTSFIETQKPIYQNGTISLAKKSNIELYDMQGRLIRIQTDVLEISTLELKSGIYLLKTSEAITFKFLAE